MRWFHWVCTVVLVALDQWTKLAAESALFQGGTVVIFPFLSLQLVHNYGAAYGILQGQRGLLIGVSALVLVAAVVFQKDIARSWISAAGLSALLGGTAGNLVDRVVHGFVIDFLVTPWFPVFNLADVLIDVGIVLLVLDAVINRENYSRKR